MKHYQKIIALFAILWIVHITYSWPLGVEEIQVIDKNTISVTLSENPNLEVWDVEGELTLLSDASLRWAILTQWSSNTVELIMEDALMPETNYSLLTINGADGSMDFTTPESLEWYTQDNISSWTNQNIKNIEIIDDRTLLIEYNLDVNSTNFEYKLLSESIIESVMKPDYFNPELIITVSPPLVWEKDYILMFIEMQDVDGEFLEFDTGIYDFVSPKLEDLGDEESFQIEESSDDTIPQNEKNSEILLAESLDDEAAQDESEEEIPDLTAAGEDTSLEKDSSQSDTWETVGTLQAAAEMTQTPETGAQTWIIIFASLFINSIYYLSRRKRLTGQA